MRQQTVQDMVPHPPAQAVLLAAVLSGAGDEVGGSGAATVGFDTDEARADL